MLWNPRARTPWVAGSAPMRAPDPDGLARVVDLRLASICPAAFFPGCNETVGQGLLADISRPA